jgi:hypothetical protein
VSSREGAGPISRFGRLRRLEDHPSGQEPPTGKEHQRCQLGAVPLLGPLLWLDCQCPPCCRLTPLHHTGVRAAVAIGYEICLASTDPCLPRVRVDRETGTGTLRSTFSWLAWCGWPPTVPLGKRERAAREVWQNASGQTASTPMFARARRKRAE